MLNFLISVKRKEIKCPRLSLLELDRKRRNEYGLRGPHFGFFYREQKLTDSKALESLQGI